MSLPEGVTNLIDQALAFIYGLQPLVEPTVVLVPSFVNDQVAKLSEMIGFDEETLSYTLGLFLCYPLGMIMNSLPYGKIRHVFSFLLGMWLMQFTLGVQWIHQLISSLIAYGLLLALPRKTATMVVPTFAMLYLVFGHLHRQYINYLGYDLDFTGSQMVLTQKLYMIAFNLYDGECLAKKKDSRAAKKCSDFALDKIPSLLEFLGYTFCFSNVLTGPATEFNLYKTACEGTHLYDDKGKSKGKIPSNFMPTLVPFLVSLLNLGLFVFLGSMFPLLDPADPQKNIPVILRPDFLEKPWYQRYGYMWVGLLGVRQKYYFAWKNAEGAQNIWYAGFEGFDEKGQPKGWELSSNLNILEFETAPNVQTLSKEWNKKTSLWLTRYVYMRTNGNLAMVYALSAFWHGFYPGYYLFFLSVPLVTFCDRLGKKKISPYFSPKKWTPYGIVSIVSTSLVVEYFVSAFPLLAFDWSWNVWKSHYFFGHISCVLFYAVVSMLPTPKKKEKTT